MVNVFPDLLTFALLSPFILRVGVGALFVLSGFLLIKKTNVGVPTLPGIPKEKMLPLSIGLIEFVSGILLIAGFFTQAAALLLVFLFVVSKLYPPLLPLLPYEKETRLLLVLILVSILFTGAGAFGFDLPF